MIFKNASLDFTQNKIYIMGILNVTPDSFSDGGRHNTVDKALFHTERMLNEGADIIDVGGESTRPFSKPVSVDEELSRVIPIIEKINKNFQTIISIDTYKSEVAEESIKNGVEIINDISGLTFDSKMEIIALRYNAACVVMHIKGSPQNMQSDPWYEDVTEEIYEFLYQRVANLIITGVEKIIIDVGFGFGKNLDDNYILLKNLNRFKEIGCPILAGISRKSMIGRVIDLEPEERVVPTVSLNTIAALNGARIIRVHDVKANYDAVRVIEKYINTVPSRAL